MSFLSIYLMSIMGVVLLFVVIELILPSGSVSKYIRSILGIFLIFVVVSPLGKLKSLSFDGILYGNSAEYQLDYGYLYRMHLEKAENLANEVQQLLTSKGIEGAVVLVDVKKDVLDMQINNIFVDLSQTVISQNNEHIINYATLKKLIADYVHIEEDKVVINE